MFTVGEPPAKDPLTKLDYRIVRALAKDCRRPLQEVVAEVGSTAKTVKRRIEHMETNHWVSFSIDLVLCSSGDLISIVHAKLKTDRRLEDMFPVLLNRRDPHILGISASNVETGLMIFSMWARDLRELREAEKSLNSGEDFESMFSNLYYDMRIYPTWSQRLIDSRAK
ncbi:MAG: hypothetical protein A4E31_00768 [Methanomassiliicoccales archaeon PtaU1.Bin030]|nr:MAG: hypothetical protein A4E31_00768 [Methanomassiliicoccales archaeon PtaU1.Bin030]